RFIKNYSKVAAPLIDLTKGGNPGIITFGLKVKAAFAKIKRLFIEVPVLRHFNPKLLIRIKPDTLAFIIGRLLSRSVPRGTILPIARLPRLIGAEYNYPIHDKEILAII
ncbi:hypothetical protein ACRALDRAFT_1018038, partial [Sodiomyces alcalophilus JCM 7366]|uniref:uncharacterized protein n=1 Tax=Sodiomyces alcalophilus JCM 7366 TaxID=591952 RepID=UPI0039B5F30E